MNINIYIYIYLCTSAPLAGFFAVFSCCTFVSSMVLVILGVRDSLLKSSEIFSNHMKPNLKEYDAII